MELERDNFYRKLEGEIQSHKETVARYNADKKNILMSTEEANMEAMKGGTLTTLSCLNWSFDSQISCHIMLLSSLGFYGRECYLRDNCIAY